jgi:thymidylate kinase
MINTNLICVDGLPGSGKSTTAQLLCIHLARNGFEAEWFYEHQTSHPIYKYHDAEKAFGMSPLESKKTHERAIRNWKRLVNSRRGTNRITILESTIFQTTVGGLLLMDSREEEIIGFVSRDSEIIQELNPALIYFYQNDIAKALKSIRDRRGEPFETFLVSQIGRTPYGKERKVENFEGVVAFYQDLREITDRIFSASAFHKIAIESSRGRWEHYHERITKFLSVGRIDYAAEPPNDFGDFVGRYREVKSSDEFVIATDGKFLYLDDPSKTRLIHKGNTTFWVQGMCIEFSFKKNQRGAVTSIRCNGDLPGLGKLWVKV